jgi:hypothetical protein
MLGSTRVICVIQKIVGAFLKKKMMPLVSSGFDCTNFAHGGQGFVSRNIICKLLYEIAHSEQGYVPPIQQKRNCHTYGTAETAKKFGVKPW